MGRGTLGVLGPLKSIAKHTCRMSVCLYVGHNCDMQKLLNLCCISNQ